MKALFMGILSWQLGADHALHEDTLQKVITAFTCMHFMKRRIISTLTSKFKKTDIYFHFFLCINEKKDFPLTFFVKINAVCLLLHFGLQ